MYELCALDQRVRLETSQGDPPRGLTGCVMEQNGNLCRNKKEWARATRRTQSEPQDTHCEAEARKARQCLEQAASGYG